MIYLGVRKILEIKAYPSSDKVYISRFSEMIREGY